MKYFILIISVFALVFSSCRVDPKKRFVLSPKEALVAANHQTNVLSPHLLADILYVEDSSLNYVFVDLRNPLEYESGHIEGAINIPFTSMTKNNNCNTFLDKDAINIIYGSSTEEVVFAGFILQQIGVKNFFIVHGNYKHIKENILDKYQVLSASFNPETPKYDFKELVSAGKQGTKSNPKKKEAAIAAPITRKTVEESGGGCD
jgi:rhodanese-related sulfurtransferase